MNIKHSILVITYKQENVISDCLESIVNQTLSPYEVVVVDDCSPDNTWNVILKYAAKYPIIKPYRNKSNLGCFGNFNNAIKLLTGNFINIVAGDDFLPSDILEKYDKFINSNSLDCNSPFLIFTNSIVLRPDGKYVFKDNSKAFDVDKMFERACLQCFWSWDTGISRGVWNKLSGIRTNIGYQADLLWHLDKIVSAEQYYFLNTVGYIYRMNVGVTIATSLVEHYNSRCLVYDEIKKKYPHNITKNVNRFFELDKSFLQYNVYPSVENYLVLFRNFLLFGKPPRGSRYRDVKILIPISIKKIVKKLIQNKI